MITIPDAFAQRILTMHGDAGRILARQVDQLAEELGLDRERVRGWGLYQAVLSAWWDVEDKGQPSDMSLACAALLAAI